MSPVTIFAVLNFVLAACCVLVILYRIFDITMMFSGSITEQYKTPYMIVEGASIVFSIIFLALYVVAGIGLLKRTAWGYYLHLIVAGCSFFSFFVYPCCCCGGILYLIPAFVFGTMEAFRSEFPGLQDS
ncbi:MAG: hypothetical protein K2X66_12820 [Cyanobacteria bacterium]|nr:hypothetical protein [Cyanobacteriota bacterium]